MPDNTDHFHKAFSRVSAFAILKDGRHVANISFKLPGMTHGRLYAFANWIGLPIVRGMSSGHGDDKRSAALAHAVRQMLTPGEFASDEDLRDFIAALERDGGEYWQSRLHEFGFTVLQVL